MLKLKQGDQPLVWAACESVLHFIVARSRAGWSVNVEADRLSEHDRPEEARAEAEMLIEQSENDGAAASLVDLSRHDE